MPRVTQQVHPMPMLLDQGLIFATPPKRRALCTHKVYFQPLLRGANELPQVCGLIGLVHFCNARKIKCPFKPPLAGCSWLQVGCQPMCNVRRHATDAELLHKRGAVSDGQRKGLQEADDVGGVLRSCGMCTHLPWQGIQHPNLLGSTETHPCLYHHKPSSTLSHTQTPPHPHTCTGLGKVRPTRPNCSAMDMTTLPPKLCPISTSGNSFNRPSSFNTSDAADSTPWGPPEGATPLAADSPWHRKSTSNTCHEGNSCRRRLAKVIMLRRCPRMPWTRTAVGGVRPSAGGLQKRTRGPPTSSYACGSVCGHGHAGALSSSVYPTYHPRTTSSTPSVREDICRV